MVHNLGCGPERCEIEEIAILSAHSTSSKKTGSRVPLISGLVTDSLCIQFNVRFRIIHMRPVISLFLIVPLINATSALHESHTFRSPDQIYALETSLHVFPCSSATKLRAVSRIHWSRGVKLMPSSLPVLELSSL